MTSNSFLSECHYAGHVYVCIICAGLAYIVSGIIVHDIQLPIYHSFVSCKKFTEVIHCLIDVTYKYVVLCCAYRSVRVLVWSRIKLITWYDNSPANEFSRSDTPRVIGSTRDCVTLVAWNRIPVWMKWNPTPSNRTLLINYFIHLDSNNGYHDARNLLTTTVENVNRE